MEGLPEGAKPTLTLQLSSPIEEGILTTIYDPLSDPQSEGSMVTFRGVEPTVATLTVSAKDVDIPLGSSYPHDVATLCALDPMDIKDEYVTELPVAIVAEGISVIAATVSTGVVASGKDTSAVEDENRDQAEEEEEEAMVVQPICTITLRITYKPSSKDQREELYELLNITSQRKATALDNLRQISMQAANATRSSGTASEQESLAISSSTTTVAKPSVKPGFLNKQRKDDEVTRTESKWTSWYNRTVGPNSMIQNSAMLVFAAKDFVIFFGAVAFFHFQGQLLAIPPPV
jgi:hypothetical protein